MISAVIHTFNEEENIERALTSLSWVDEIVLVDMGSTDQTLKKVSQYNPRVFQHPYTGFVEPARNYAIEKAEGDWIMVLDADEAVPHTLATYLLQVSKKRDVDYYRIPRKNIIFGKWVKHAGWWPDFQIRFFKKGSVTWTDKIHGIPMTKGTGYDIEPSERLSITHYNYQSIEQFIARLNRYTTISAKELYISNTHSTVPDLFDKPTREFINRYLVWEGYKDSIHGLSLALLQAFSELVVYIKLWELEGYKEEKVHLHHVHALLSKFYGQLHYWIVNEQLKQPGNFWDTLAMKVKRKLNFYG